MDNLKQVDEVDEVEELHDLQEADFEENKEKLVEKVAEPKMWSDLIQKAKDGGLDAIETYILWNAHEPQRHQIALDDHDDDDDDVALILYSSEDTPHAGCSTGVIITAAICFSRPPLSDDRVESCFWNIRVEDLCLDFTLVGHRHYALTFGPDQKMVGNPLL
ncbi:hypothetical protein WN944_006697 [Citrus x changshan-huyou]|uniref:beta-galactosidase n=1 Tax=Citrus x changshan-huyou TaxID=2935761 RepID=A0AAP0MJL6_9ROSI